MTSKHRPGYMVWAQMKYRCLDPKAIGYKNYGGRGISVCDRWMIFENFINDMGEPPKGLTLDRRDNNGNYEPGNCTWSTPLHQSRNKRTNILLTAHGKTQCVSAWEQEMGMKRGTLGHRLRRGMTPEDAISLPVLTSKQRAIISQAARWGKPVLSIADVVGMSV